MKLSRGSSRGNKDKKEAILDPVEDRRVGKRKAVVVGKVTESSKKKMGSINDIEKLASAAAAKDPNKPKRPATAFFVFLEEFRKVYKQQHPNNKAVSAVGKAGGEKWKSMSGAEKAPYESKAANRKSEYEKLVKAYNKKQETVNRSHEDDDDEEDALQKSKKSKVNGATTKIDDEEDSEEEEDDDNDEDDEEDDD
ncbi:High mobility group B protein 1 [Linum grandiflorum]